MDNEFKDYKDIIKDIEILVNNYNKLENTHDDIICKVSSLTSEVVELREIALQLITIEERINIRIDEINNLIVLLKQIIN